MGETAKAFKQSKENRSRVQNSRNQIVGLLTKPVRETNHIITAIIKLQVHGLNPASNQGIPKARNRQNLQAIQEKTDPEIIL